MPRITDDEITNALRTCKGMIYVAADALGCSPNTIKARIAKKPDILEAIKTERGLLVDNAELSLYNAVMAGDPWAVSMTLKTLGADRGYVERQRVDNTNLNINWDDLSENELERIAAGEDAATVIAGRSAAANRAEKA